MSKIIGRTGAERQSVYLQAEIIEELRAEALRQDRSLSWLMQRAWEISRETIKRFPSSEGE